MNKFKDMSVLELYEYRKVLLLFRDKYANKFSYSNYDSLMNSEYDLDNETSKKFNYIQEQLEKIDLMLEENIFSEYVKKD
jgi:hypothetical protein